jgi:hypothetical protein
MVVMKRGRGMKKNTSLFFFTRCERMFVLINGAERRSRPLTTNKKKSKKKKREKNREKK